MRSICLAMLLIAAMVAAPGAAQIQAAAQTLAAAQGERSVRPIGPRLTRGGAAGDVALRSFEDCGQLRGHLVDVLVEALVEAMYTRGLPWSGPGDSEAPADHSSTLLQEDGVDELDIVKTDGERIVLTMNDRLRVIDSWPPEQTHLESELELGGSAAGLFLRGDTAVVLSWFWGEEERPYWGTRIQLVDLASPGRPVLVSTFEVEGQLVSARRMGGDVWLVASSQMPMPEAAWELLAREDIELPEIDWNATEEELAAAVALARTILWPYAEELIAGLDLSEILPLVRAPGAAPAPALGCADLYHTAVASRWAVLSVFHLDLDEPQPALDGVGVLSDGFTVYASAANLYVAQGSRWGWWRFSPQEMTSTVHKFELSPEGPEPVRYRASGAVDGWLLSQFSMGEHDGYLRVATSRPRWWWGAPAIEPANAVTVLADDRQGRLVQVGRVDGIAPGEEITASRFLGDRGFLVTFERVDPLFSLDLSDPTEPRVVGELKVPGFSSFLHPVSADRLLAVGMAGEDDGTITGLGVSLFDVADLAHPVLADTLAFTGGQWQWSEALWDHHAVTYHREVLTMPASYWDASGYFSGLLVVGAPAAGPLTSLGRVDHQDLPPFPGGGSVAWMRRSVIIENNLYSISDRGVKVTGLRTPGAVLAVVPFAP